MRKEIAETLHDSISALVSIKTQIEVLSRFNKNFDIKTYNIIQEFINNILKHSKANNAFIKL